MRDVLFCLYFVSLFFAGCSVRSSNIDNKEIAENDSLLTPPFLIDLEKVAKAESEVKLSTIANHVFYAPLETSPSVLLRQVRECIPFDSTFLIHDYRNLYMFTNQGKLVRKIGNRGTGPADYTLITSVVVDSTSLYLFTPKKMNVYSKEGEYVRSVTLSDQYDYLYSGVFTSTNDLFMFLGVTYKLVGENRDIYSFVQLDTLGRIKSKIRNNSPVESTYPGAIIMPTPLYRYRDEVHYMDYGNDTVFTILPDDKIDVYAIVSLGDMKRETNLSGYDDEKTKDLSSKLFINSICEDDDFLYITLVWGVTDVYQYLLFDKKSGNIMNLGDRGFVNDIDGGPSFFPRLVTRDGRKIMWMNAEKFLELSDKSTSVKEDDNPVVIQVFKLVGVSKLIKASKSIHSGQPHQNNKLS